MTAPKIVEGSMTNMRSQSIIGFLMKECLLPMLNSRLAKAPPTIVKFDSATAYLAENPESMVTSNQDRRSAEPNDKCLDLANINNNKLAGERDCKQTHTVNSQKIGGRS